MRPAYLLVAGALSTPILAGGAAAQTVSVTVPQLKVAEYHRPYVAGWLDPAAGGPVKTVFVWYDVKKGGAEPGTKWLADLRSWWRKGGRTMKLPADGVSGATRAPGTYQIPLPKGLPAGQYILNVEAARETGGRELVRVPITVPRASGTAKGSTELGTVTIR
jgi:hypothetical protein